MNYLEHIEEVAELRTQLAERDAEVSQLRAFVKLCADGFFIADAELRGAARAALTTEPAAPEGRQKALEITTEKGQQ